MDPHGTLIHFDGGSATIIAYGVRRHADFAPDDADYDPGDPVTTYTIVQPTPVEPMTHDALRAALEDATAPGGCGCAHDCCGHRFGSSTARMLTLDRWEIEVFTARNF